MKAEYAAPTVLVDPNVVGDIEEISDTDKVSLISDVELPDPLDVL